MFIFSIIILNTFLFFEVFKKNKLRRANDPWETRQTEAAGSPQSFIYISIYYYWQKNILSLKKKKKKKKVFFFFDWQVGEEE
jgi:hypothetical protein